MDNETMEKLDKMLQMTDGGKRVFECFLGDLVNKKSFCNPFREDHNASAAWYRTKTGRTPGQLKFMDFANDYWNRMSCVDLVIRNEGLESHPHKVSEALHIIDNMLSLGLYQNEDKKYGGRKTGGKKDFKVKLEVYDNPQPAEDGRSRDARNTGNYVDVVVPRKMYPSELQYWAQYGIGEDTLTKYGVSSVASKYRQYEDGSRSKSTFSPKEANEHTMFAYKYGNGEGYRIYRPMVGKDKSGNYKYPRFQVVGKQPYPYVFGWEQLPKNAERVYITGGEKDVMSLAAHGFNAVTFGSESNKIPLDYAEKLAGRFKDIVIMFDSDTPGINDSIARYNELKDDFNVHRVQLPLDGDKRIDGKKADKDISDFFRDGHSPEELVKLTDKAIDDDSLKIKNSEQKGIVKHQSL